jgi:BirA family biotin operon repressor/biotin-[acetyl-CoA-carboxylase] ligase
LYNITPKTLFIGKNIIYLPTCHSTNDTAASLLRDGKVFEGTLVVTSNQTAGRGQRGNKWEAETGKNLTFSLILKPAYLTPNEQFYLNIAVSLGIYEFLNGFFAEEDIKIKWPNDIYYKDKKMGGVLIENVLKKSIIESAVIGIGLNVNQLQFAHAQATSMRLASHSPTIEFDLEMLLTHLAECLERSYLQLRSDQRKWLHEQYLQHLYWYREKHIFSRDGKWFEGLITGIDATGRLTVETDGILHYFGLKEIEFIR